MTEPEPAWKRLAPIFLPFPDPPDPDDDRTDDEETEEKRG